MASNRAYILLGTIHLSYCVEIARLPDSGRIALSIITRRIAAGQRAFSGSISRCSRYPGHTEN
jgi:hypothetical protein